MSNEKCGKLDEKGLRSTLSKLHEHVEEGKLIQINKQVLATWTCFTDGACEEQCTVGGVLVAPSGKPVSAFGSVIPERLSEHLFRNSKHPIYEVELVPLLVAMLLWGDLVNRSQIVFYIDNDAARSGLIKGAGATMMADAMIECFCSHESALNLKSWFSRVPSHSNPSDGPSRLQFDLAMACDRIRGLVTPQLSGALAGRGLIVPNALRKIVCRTIRVATVFCTT